ncbi:unnamed protein product [Caenorhabditis brenneri]
MFNFYSSIFLYLFIMSDRYKYAKNGIYKCENFAEHVEANDFQTFSFDRDIDDYIWSLKFNVENKDNSTFACLGLSSTSPSEYRLRTFFNVLKKDGSTGSMRRENNWTWQFENEYLDDGSLSIEYGIHLDAIAIEHKTWEFNFYETGFNHTADEKQIAECTFKAKRHRPVTFYCSTEIINFHSPELVGQAKKRFLTCPYIDNVSDCLQLLHGVQIQHLVADDIDYFDMLKIAHTFKLFNVIRYCDCPSNEGSLAQINSMSLDKIIKYNLKHILAERLKYCEWEDMVNMAKQMRIREASGEIMKMFVAKILYN